MDREANNTSVGHEEVNSETILESPLKKLTRPKIQGNYSLQPQTQDGSVEAIKRVKIEVATTRHTLQKTKLSNVSFELYSHATDPLRIVESVHSVAGVPIPLLKDGLQWEDTYDTSEEQPNNSSSSEQEQQFSSKQLITQKRVYDVQSFDKISQIYLNTLSDSGSQAAYSLECYVYRLEALLLQRSFIPPEQLSQVVSMVMNSTSNDLVSRFHCVLCQDLALRGNNLPRADFIINTLTTLIQTLTAQCTHTPSLVLLNYITGMLKKNRMHVSLTKEIASLQVPILDLVFSTVTQYDFPVQLECLPSLPVTLLSLLYLPLCSSHDSMSYELAEAISCRLDGLPTSKDKYLLLRSLPSSSLCEMVIDSHLQNFFLSRYQSDCSPVKTLKDISKKHFKRSPYRPTGVPHDITFFLSLLCMMVESHLSHEKFSTCHNDLSDLKLGIRLLTSSLYEDPLLVDKLSNTDVWKTLKLFTALTEIDQ